MSTTLELPEPLVTELETQAEREGVSPDDHAALLLYIVTALHDVGKKSTLFQEAVEEFCTAYSLDTKKVAYVLDELVHVCIAPIGAALPLALGQWKDAMVHDSVNAGNGVFVAVHSPIDVAVQHRGRIDGNDHTVEPVGPSLWPAGFFEETYGSLADEPIERLPQGQNEIREPVA